MPLYTRKITCPANSEVEEEIEIEGYAITFISVFFPPGCLGLVSVSFWYGVKQIAPYEEGTDIRGSGEAINFEEFWILPENPCRIKIKVKNEDDTYSHTVFIRIVVKKKVQLLGEQIARGIINALRRIFGFM